MKPIVVQFHKGIQFPPNLGSQIFKVTSPGKLAYAQNIDSFNDEYGNGSITPGPQLKDMVNSNLLTGVPFAKSFFGNLAFGFLYFIQGLLGETTKIRRIKQVISSNTPNLDNSVELLVDHGPGHANLILVDILMRTDSNGVPYTYVSGKDNVDTFIFKFIASDINPTLTLVATNSSFSGRFTDQFLVKGSDNNVYWIGQRTVSSIDTSDAYNVNALLESLPLGAYASCGVDWNENLVVAYSTDAFGDWGRRVSAGKSGIVLWDYQNDNFQKDIPAPCRYISALVVDPNGNLLCFGGVDGGKSSIYEFTGYGFNWLYSYVGDLPHSHHSIEFDGQGRIIFQTADGQICRYDKQSGIFDVLAKLDTNNSAGGIFARAIGSPVGNDFIAASGKDTEYNLKIVSFGSFTGSSDGTGINAPLAISGTETIPNDSTISIVTWNITRALKEGEKVVLLLYVNGLDTPIEYSTMDFDVDGAIMSKRETTTIPGVNSFSLGVLWKMQDGQLTAPAVLPAEVEIT